MACAVCSLIVGGFFVYDPPVSCCSVVVACGMCASLWHVHRLPHIPQATTTEQHETGGSLKNAFQRLSYIPHMPQAIATEQHETGESLTKKLRRLSHILHMPQLFLRGTQTQVSGLTPTATGSVPKIGADACHSPVLFRSTVAVTQSRPASIHPPSLISRS